MRNRILVVEDDEFIRGGISDLLQFEGFIVEESANGKEGLEKLSTFKPDIILSDVMMPVMDGHEFLEEYNKLEGSAQIPFIFLTALSEREQLMEGMNLGADGYITKPFTREELMTIVNTQCLKKNKREKVTRQKYELLLQELSTSAEKEKVTLLKELHHRVKNNLALISALFEINDDGFSKEYLASLRNRIFALASVHEEAYSNEMLSSVDTEKLVSNIINKVITDDKIIIEKNIIPFELDLDKAIPFGLLFYELLSNAVKHAFKNKRKRIISIQLQQQEEEKILTVEDNGSGFDETQIIEKTGILLINLLTDQLHGKIKRTSKPKTGTKYTIRF